MTHAYFLPINKIRLIGILRNQKKTRKNSAPKVMLTSTFSPDGANNVFLKSIDGSFSNIKFLMYFESIIGNPSINFAFVCSVLSPSIETICFINLHVTFGATLPFGYVSPNFSISCNSL